MNNYGEGSSECYGELASRYPLDYWEGTHCCDCSTKLTFENGCHRPTDDDQVEELVCVSCLIGAEKND